MPEWRTPDVECRVFTFAEGMLSPLAHDLEIAVREGAVIVDGQRVTARFDAGSLEVAGTVKGGRTDPGGLSKSDYRKIEETVRSEVLRSGRYPEVKFEGTLSGDPKSGGALEIEGELELHGTSRPLRATARRADEGWVVEVSLHQPDFGIRPYRAMMGTLKVKADVRVRVSVPLESP